MCNLNFHIRNDVIQWVTGIVISIEDELLNFGYKTGEDDSADTKWFERDSDKIYSVNKMCGNIRKKEIDILVKYGKF